LSTFNDAKVRLFQEAGKGKNGKDRARKQNTSITEVLRKFTHFLQTFAELSAQKKGADALAGSLL